MGAGHCEVLILVWLPPGAATRYDGRCSSIADNPAGNLELNTTAREDAEDRERGDGTKKTMGI